MVNLKRGRLNSLLALLRWPPGGAGEPRGLRRTEEAFSGILRLEGPSPGPGHVPRTRSRARPEEVFWSILTGLRWDESCPVAVGRGCGELWRFCWPQRAEGPWGKGASAGVGACGVGRGHEVSGPCRPSSTGQGWCQGLLGHRRGRALWGGCARGQQCRSGVQARPRWGRGACGRWVLVREGLRLQEGWELRGRERGQGQEWGEPRSLGSQGTWECVEPSRGGGRHGR